MRVSFAFNSKCVAESTNQVSLFLFQFFTFLFCAYEPSLFIMKLSYFTAAPIKKDAITWSDMLMKIENGKMLCIIETTIFLKPHVLTCKILPTQFFIVKYAKFRERKRVEVEVATRSTATVSKGKTPVYLVCSVSLKSISVRARKTKDEVERSESRTESETRSSEWNLRTGPAFYFAFILYLLLFLYFALLFSRKRNILHTYGTDPG